MRSERIRCVGVEVEWGGGRATESSCFAGPTVEMERNQVTGLPAVANQRLMMEDNDDDRLLSRPPSSIHFLAVMEPLIAQHRPPLLHFSPSPNRSPSPSVVYFLHSSKFHWEVLLLPSVSGSLCCFFCFLFRARFRRNFRSIASFLRMHFHLKAFPKSLLENRYSFRLRKLNHQSPLRPVEFTSKVNLVNRVLFFRLHRIIVDAIFAYF